MKRVGAVVLILLIGFLSFGNVSAGFGDWVGSLFRGDDHSWGITGNVVESDYDGLDSVKYNLGFNDKLILEGKNIIRVDNIFTNGLMRYSYSRDNGGTWILKTIWVGEKYIQELDDDLFLLLKEINYNSAKNSDSTVNIVVYGGEPSECVDGACIGESEDNAGCSDGDGLNYYKKGYMNRSAIAGYWDLCVDASYVKEWYCNSNGGFSFIQYLCPKGCSDGACLSEKVVVEDEVESCVDSDGGLNYDVKGNLSGSVSIYGLVFDDYCSNSENLTEFYCSDDPGVFSQEYRCPNGCANGVCANKGFSKCADSDGGLNYSKKGTIGVEGVNGIWMDRCQITEENGEKGMGVDNCKGKNCGIEEVFCDKDGNVDFELRNCFGDCVDGACVNSPVYVIVGRNASNYDLDISKEILSWLENEEDHYKYIIVSNYKIGKNDLLYTMGVFVYNRSVMVIAGEDAPPAISIMSDALQKYLDSLDDVGNCGNIDSAMLISDNFKESLPEYCKVGTSNELDKYCGDRDCQGSFSSELKEGKDMRFNFDEKEYYLELDFIGDNRIVAILDGESFDLDIKETIEMENGLLFRLDNIKYSSKDSGESIVYFTVGENEISCPKDCTADEGDDVIIFHINQGWNLVMGFVDPDEQIVGGDIREDDIIVVYALMSNVQEYARAWPKPEWEKLEAVDEDELLSNGFWVYSDKAGDLEYELFEKPVVVDERQIFKGWNLVGISSDMANNEFKDLVGDCDILGSYGFDGDRQNWQKIFLNQNVVNNLIGTTWVIKVSENCQLDVPDRVIEIPEFPEIIEVDEPSEIGTYKLNRNGIYSDNDCDTINKKNVCINITRLGYQGNEEYDQTEVILINYDDIAIVENDILGDIRNISIVLENVYGIGDTYFIWFAENSYDLIVIEMNDKTEVDELVRYFYDKYGAVDSLVDVNYCVDDDRGRYHLPGTTYAMDIKSYDACDSDSVLNESKCDADSVIIENYICENGCMYGRCLDDGECIMKDVTGKVCRFDGIEYLVNKSGCNNVHFEISYGDVVEDFTLDQGKSFVLKNGVMFVNSWTSCDVNIVNAYFRYQDGE
jgi:hypothetical protein